MTSRRSLSQSFLPASLGIGLFGLPLATLVVPTTVQAADAGAISGKVVDKKSGKPLKDALVILQCTCLQGERNMTTGAAGIYAFRDLPPGKYTVQVVKDEADESKITTLPRGAKIRANFAINPSDKFTRVVQVEATAVQSTSTQVGTVVDVEQVKDVPVGGTSRDFTAVVDLSPTASKGAGGGVRLGGTTIAENKYVVDGADVTNPSFGTVGASIVQEFVGSVEVVESGYDAEFGGASGGQIRARRVSGSNQVRGQAVIRYTPRLRDPRFIINTDEALRVTQVPDYQIAGVLVASGPIIKDKLFWTVGVSPSGTKATLVQSFYTRALEQEDGTRGDKDGSGGYEDCQYENGDNDCADGHNYIDNEKFAEQRFKTTAAGIGYQAGIDWAINPKHRVDATVRGGPSFARTTYRLPFSLDPNAFGNNPGASPLGGASRIATGIVNDHFGTTLGNTTSVALNYLGRVFDDKMEIEGGAAYTRFFTQDAWKLDNPELRNTPATQKQDGQGANLFKLLDEDGAVDLVPGVAGACNDPDLPPGLSCPVRRWLSGGLGRFERGNNSRVEARLNFTHFFNAAGSHQLKYGTAFSHDRQNLVSQYSGSNEPDFYDNCSAGQTGGGEWCYDPDNGYQIQTTPRVNNRRFIIVDTDNPDLRRSVGVGRIRHEENDLRAIATPIGNGVRVDSYDETLSTENYSVFLQDKWAVLSNLYLNAGVRWEAQDMRTVLGDRGILIADNIAPRVGLVYDWTDEGKSRLYASWGWFYQNLPLLLNSRVFGGLVNVQRTYRNSDCQGRVVIDGQGRDMLDDGGQPTEYCVDTNAATSGLTVGSKVPKLKGMYNQQFQVGYEQEVIEDLVLGVQWLHTDLGRAVEDVSTNGGVDFLIANPGEAVSESSLNAKRNECAELETLYDQAQADGAEDATARLRDLNQCNFLVNAFERVNTLFDKPTRNYDAWTFRLQKRFSKNWLLLGSYTYSRLIGNYDGFVNPTTGAINIGASTQYDIPALVRNSFGPLSFNQPHRFKIDGFYSFDLKEAGRLTLGTSVRYASGFPVSLRADHNRYPGQFLVYLLPRGSGGRIEPNYQWNLSLSYAYPLPKDLELELAGRLLNVTNSKAVLRVDQIYTFQTSRPIAGGTLEDLKHAKIQNASAPDAYFQRNIVAPQGNYGVETQFQTPMAGQLELRLRF